jgi:hypothetical protein
LCYPRVFLRHPRVFLPIRQYFSLSASISRYPRVFLAIREYFSLSESISPPSESISRYPRVFLAIREYFSPSESISRYPPVFLAIRQYFSLSASISRHPPVFLAIREYFSPSASISRLSASISCYPPISPPKKIPDLMSRMSNLLFIRNFINGLTIKSFDHFDDQLYGIFIVITVKHRCMSMDITRCNRNRQCRYAIMG